MRGRKPKPVKAIEIDTSPGHAPDYLSEPAKRLYRKLARELAQVLTSVDATTLASYCACHARWVEVEGIIESDGVLTENGRPHPLFRISDALLRQMKNLGSELGLSPLSRGRIQAPERAEDDLDSFLEEYGT